MSDFVIGGIKFDTEKIFKSTNTTKKQEIYKKYMDIIKELEKAARIENMKEFYFKPAVFQYDDKENVRLYDTDDGRKITLTGPDSSDAIAEIKQEVNKDNPDKYSFSISKTSSNKGYTITLKDIPQTVEPKDEPKKDTKKSTSKKEPAKKSQTVIS